MSENLVNELISTLEKAIENTNVEIANLEEEFRKKLEEAKASLNDQLDEMKQQYNYWLSVRGDAPKPEKKPRKKREKKEEVPAPPQDATEVVDTIYPENNEPEDTTEEPMPDLPEPVEETNASSGSLFDFPEDPSSAPTEEAEVPAEPVIEDDWSTPKDTVVENEPVDLDDFAMPEEWK